MRLFYFIRSIGIVTAFILHYSLVGDFVAEFSQYAIYLPAIVSNVCYSHITWIIIWTWLQCIPRERDLWAITEEIILNLENDWRRLTNNWIDLGLKLSFKTISLLSSSAEVAHNENSHRLSQQNNSGSLTVKTASPWNFCRLYFGKKRPYLFAHTD